MLLLEIGLKSLCGTVVLLQIAPYCLEGKACVKHRAQLSCARNWRQNTLHNCLFVRNWPFLLKSQTANFQATALLRKSFGQILAF